MLHNQQRFAPEEICLVRYDLAIRSRASGGSYMGDSYYYHHVKHHHVENNGPEDLSSTIRYQRDELWNCDLYVGRFVAFVWIELPLYFMKRRKNALALKVAVASSRLTCSSIS